MGGQIKFALTLVIFNTLANNIFSQPGEYYIEGESLWRNQSYGVSNHSFDIKNFIAVYHHTYPLGTDPITVECNSEYYSTEEMPLYSEDEDLTYNTLEIRPYSDNDRADYMNGVSTLDLYKIYHHIHDSPVFEDMEPEEDAPFRYISADADNDMDVDDNDIYMIQQMILDYRDNLNRDSWEWVWKDEVEEDAERFEEEPYEFVISYNWPGADGIIIPSVSTDQIQYDNDKYFGFRTTKVGDIVGAGFAQVTTNDWICGDGYYFTENNPQVRSYSTTGEISKVRKGSIITFEVSRNDLEDILTFELPILIPQEDFNFQSIQFFEGFHPLWHYNPTHNNLTVLEFSKNKEPLAVSKGKIFTFKIVANNDVNDARSLVGFYGDRKPEITGMDEKLVNLGIQVKITDVLPPDLYLEIRSDGSNNQAYIESPKDQKVTLQLINYQGIVLESKRFEVSRGKNNIPLNFFLPNGLYFIQINNDIQTITEPLTIQ